MVNYPKIQCLSLQNSQGKAGDEINLVGPINPFLAKVNNQLKTILLDKASEHKSLFPLGKSIGDGDSTDHLMDVKFSKDKDFSDLAGALQTLQSPEIHMHCYGMLGGRLDHELMNLGEIHHYFHSKKASWAFFIERDRWLLLLSPGEWKIDFSGTFSMLSLTENQVQLKGKIQYPYDGIVKTLTSLGLSNVATGEFQIKLQHPILLYFPLELF